MGAEPAIPAPASRPEWISGPPREYPRERFVVGVGSGPDRGAAEDRARTEVAKFFRSVVSGKSLTVATYRDDGGPQGAKGTQTGEFTAQVETNATLTAVAIADTYSENGTHWALAVLDRRAAAASLARRAAGLHEAIPGLLARAKSGAALDRVRWRGAALRSSRELQAVREQALLLDPSSTDAAMVPVEDLQAALADARAQLSFGLEASGHDPEGLRAAIRGALTSAGFRVAPGAQGDLVVRCKGEIHPAPQAEPSWVFVRWRAAVELVDAASGRSLASAAPAGREGHRTADGASGRASAAMKAAVAEAVAEQVATVAGP